MRRTPWQNAIVLTLFGASIATACVVSSSDGTDDDDGGSGGFGNSSGKGGSGGKGGSDSKGGTTSTAGATSEGGDTGTTGGAPASNGGAPGIVATCDPVETGGQGGGSMIVGTPYPDCDPTDADDECQACIQTNCCEESKNCNAFEPNNVCGYGGPSDYVGNGGEFLCWQECINERVAIGAGGAPSDLPDTVDLDMSQECLSLCATPADYGPDCSGLAGDETNAITTCVFENCDAVCFY